jgi:hypothetical protein
MHLMRTILVISLLLLISLPSATLLASEGDEPTTPMDEVVVTGEQPGPAMWKVSKNDHVLWIYGTLDIIPKNATWKSHQVEATIASSREVLPGSVSFGNVTGFFKTMAFLHRLNRAEHNTHGRALAQILPPDLYQRFKALQLKYAPKDRNIERLRPMWAALSLRTGALTAVGLTSLDIESRVVEFAQSSHVNVTSLSIDGVDFGKGLSAAEKSAGSDDLSCLEFVVDQLENQIGPLRARANAWATGNVAALRGLPPELPTSCNFLSDAFGSQDLAERARKAWIDAAESALSKNDVTFAILDVQELLAPEGHLAALRARGYAVEEP